MRDMQQGGSSGSGYGVSAERTSSFIGTHVEAASPISSRPPAQGNFDELGLVGGSFGDEGEEVERGVSGNRWPRQETLALLKIRSEMDAIFRDATLKGPLWEDVSRYTRKKTPIRLHITSSISEELQETKGDCFWDFPFFFFDLFFQ